MTAPTVTATGTATALCTRLGCDRIAYRRTTSEARDWAGRHYEQTGHVSRIVTVDVETWPGEA